MATADLADRLSERCAARGVPCARELAARLAAYIGLLTKWNKTVNLTALPLDPISDDAIDRLIVEALLAAGMIEGMEGGHLFDLGSGGGSPAIPLKIAHPGLRLSMVESKERKSAFLREAIRHLSLADSTVITTRFEHLASDRALDAAAQLVSVRAVRLDETAWRSIDFLVSPGGALLWFRSSLESTASFPASFARETSIQIPDGKGEILLLRKPVR